MKVKRGLSLALVLTLCAGLFTVPAGAAGVSVTEVVACKYEWVLDFSEGLAAVAVPGSGVDEWGAPARKWGFVNTDGEEVIACRYDDVEDFSEGLAAVRLDGKWGFIDKTGQVVVPCRYSLVTSFSEGLASVGEPGEGQDQWGNPLYNWSYIDQTGKEVIPPRYCDYACPFHEGLAALTRFGGEKWSFMDKTGKEIVPCQYDNFQTPVFSEGLAVIEKDYLYGFLDKTGREVVPPRYDSAEPFSEGLAAVRTGDWENQKWGFIDQSGRAVIPCQFDDVVMDINADRGFSEGFAAVGLDGKYGFIDKTGRVVIPCRYEAVFGFYEGLAAVCLDGKWGFIDKAGQTVIPFQYDNAGSFARGVAAVAVDSGRVETWGDPIYQWGLIDVTGREVLPCQYSMHTNEANEVYGAIEGMVAVERDDKWGFFAVTGDAAQPSTQSVTLDGESVEFAMYALDNGATNYIRVRDLAALLNGTAAQFEVGWDGNVALTAKTPYTGAKDSAPFATTMPYTVYNQPTYVNGAPVTLDAIQIAYNDGGYTYYKLRDLAQALGFNVGWSADKGVYVETDKPYDPAN